MVINSEKTRLLERSALSCPSLTNSTVVSPPEASQIRGISWMPWRWAQDTAPLFPAPQRPAFARVCINPCKASQKCCPAPFFLSAFILVLPSHLPSGRERCSRRAQLRGWQQPGSRWAITATPRAGHTSPCHMGSSAFDSKMTEEGMRNTTRARRWEGSDARRAAAGNRSVTSRAWGSKRQTWGPFGHPATTRGCSQPAGFSPKRRCPFWCRGRALSPRHRRAPRARCRRLRGILAEWLNLYFPTASHGFFFFCRTISLKCSRLYFSLYFPFVRADCPSRWCNVTCKQAE